MQCSADIVSLIVHVGRSVGRARGLVGVEAVGGADGSVQWLAPAACGPGWEIEAHRR